MFPIVLLNNITNQDGGKLTWSTWQLWIECSFLLVLVSLASLVIVLALSVTQRHVRERGSLSPERSVAWLREGQNWTSLVRNSMLWLYYDLLWFKSEKDEWKTLRSRGRFRRKLINITTVYREQIGLTANPKTTPKGAGGKVAAWIIIVSVLGGLLLFGLAGFALYRVSVILLSGLLPYPHWQLCQGVYRLL